MFTKFFHKFTCTLYSINGNNSKLISNSLWRCASKSRNIHDWKRQKILNDEKRKVIPRLVYLHNPWKYFLTKLNLLKFRIFWDPQFIETEFIRGAKQAAVVLTNIIRKQNGVEIKQFTTPIGYRQITRDMLLSRDDSRLKLVRFQPEHLRRAIPMNVATKENYGRRYCFIDMLFVGLRNTKDFESTAELVEIKEILRKLDTDLQTPIEVLSAPHRIVFAEIFIRFRRDYTEYPPPQPLRQRSEQDDKDWTVSFYKILTFDILNYDPKH